MAALWTRLEAVNMVLAAMGITNPVADLDTTGSSEATKAERVLDQESKRAQLEGFFGNRVMSKEYTAASSIVTLGTDVIAIKAAGPSQHRHFDIRRVGSANLVYDLDRDTSAFTTGDKIYLDITVELLFENCPVYMQDAILTKACQIFQRRLKGNPVADEALGQERVRAEAAGGRASGTSASERDNPPPFSLAPPPGGRGGGG